MDRRAFLAAGLTTVAAMVTEPVLVAGQSEQPAMPERAFPRDYWNDLPNRMTAQMAAARQQRKSDLARVTSTAAAADRIAFIRAHVWECIGGELKSTPLNPVITGVIERENYRIEKVVFESQPSFYVTAHLYLPKSGARPCPGILAPLGHYPEGKLNRSYQLLFQNLARQGFAVLAFDPPGQGERLQYLDAAKTQSLYGPTGEHDRFGWPALLVGSSTTQLEAWDGIRALDYLVSRPEIDATRIGCCGHSGGGTQAMYLCALEPRIKVAVVVEGHTENLAGAGYQAPGAYADAEQNLIGGLKFALDRGDLLGAFAPRPLRICYSPIDNASTYSPHYIEGTKEIYEELGNLYAVYGAREKVGLFASTLPHAYDYMHRHATYEWFHQWLQNGQGNTDEVAFEDAPLQSLWCTTTGQVLTSLGGRQAYQVNHDCLRAARAATKGKPCDARALQRELANILNVSSESRPAVATTLSSRTHNSITVEEFEYESEPGIRVPGWLLKPSAVQSKYPVVMMTADEGRNAVFERWPFVERVIGMGIAICSIDLRTCGITRPRLPASGPSFYEGAVGMAYALVNLSLGTPILGQQTRDLLRGIDVLSARVDVDADRIAICGSGISGLVGVAATVLDRRVRSLLLNRSLMTLESVVASKDYDYPISAVAFGLARDFDIPELCATLAPRPLCLLNSIGANGEVLARSEIRDAYAVAEQAYAQGKEKDNFSVRVEPDPADEAILAWIHSIKP